MSADNPDLPDMVVMYTRTGDSKELFTEPLTYEAALKQAERLKDSGENVYALVTIEHANQRKAVQRLEWDVDETHRSIQAELARQAGVEAGRVRDLLVEAVTQNDSKAIRSEAGKWSGYIAATLLEIASRLDELSTPAAEGEGL